MVVLTVNATFLILVAMSMAEEATQLTKTLIELQSLLLTITPLIPMIDHTLFILVLTVVALPMEHRFGTLIY